MKQWFAALLSAAAIVSSAQAASVFSEDFEDEIATEGNTVFNYNSFDTFTVTSGAVDLVLSGTFSITCQEGSGCIDLDGTPSPAETPAAIISSDVSFVVGQVYTLSFYYSGNQRGGASDTLTYGIGGLFSKTITNIAPTQGFVKVEEIFTVNSPVTAALTFSDPTTTDFLGVILDDINIVSEPVPVPFAGLLFLTGLAGLRARARSKR